MPTVNSSAAHARAPHAPAVRIGGKQRSMKDRLVGHLKRQWVSPLQALELVGCLSLSQRCGQIEAELKAGGTGAFLDRRWKVLDSGKRVREYRIVSPTRWTA